MALLSRRFDGIDGSHHQPDAGPLDLRAVRAIPTDWFAWKATQSARYVDPTFASVRKQAIELGFRHRLWYHWLSPDVDPLAQAEHYLRTVGYWIPGDGVMLDAEEGGITVEDALVWLERVEATIQRPAAVYSGIYVAGGTMWRDPRIRTSKYGDRPMHLAAYVRTPERLQSLLELRKVAHLPIHAWQWSSDGPVPGVTGRCDMNEIVDLKAFDRACGVVTVAPNIITVPAKPAEVQEDDMVIITNAEQFFENAPGVVKFVLMDDGRLRHVGLLEWAARGQKDGVAWLNEHIIAAGIWEPTAT